MPNVGCAIVQHSGWGRSVSGLFGYLSGTGTEPASQVAERMGARMRHQPYYVIESTAPFPNVALGRLRIGVFNREPQPLRSRDGQVWAWLCGEFYHQQGRRAELATVGALRPEAEDAELALQVYLREGAAGLTKLEGVFTVAVWDSGVAELLLVNDRYGRYPHYYSHQAHGFAFAPEMKGVLEAPGVPRRMDLTAIAQYVRFQQFLGDRTWFEDVHLLPPATVLRYRPADDRLSLAPYWDWDQIGSLAGITLDEAAEEFIRLFQRAINAMTSPPHRIGVYLSGGLDSRTILGFIDRQLPVTTITYGDPACRDVAYAAELARRADRTHYYFPFLDGRWLLDYSSLHLALTEGIQSWIHAHGISTLAEARTLLDVNLDGLLGGSIMKGWQTTYERDRVCRDAADEPTVVQRIYDAFCRWITWPGLTESEAETLLTEPGDGRLSGLAFDSLRAEVARSNHYPPDRRWDFFFLHQHIRRSIMGLCMFKRSAIELRFPFSDYELVTFVYALPEHIRATLDRTRTVITRRMPHLATVPYERDNRLPHSNRLLRESHGLLQRAKNRINRHVAPVFPQQPRLYANYEHYLRTDLREWGERILFDRRTEQRGLFDQGAVRALWQRHQSGKELWTIGKIAPLMTIELVFRSLFDGDADSHAS
jgi:asparagine synthase (glutamine-hydrolysing)